MLSTVNYTPLICLGGLIMYSIERSVQFSRKTYCDDLAKGIDIFSIVSQGFTLYFYAVH